MEEEKVATSAETPEPLGQEVPPPDQPAEPEVPEKKTPIVTLIISVVLILASMVVIWWAFSGGSISDLFGGTSSTSETEEESADVEESDEMDEEDADTEEEDADEEDTLGDIVAPSTDCDNLVTYASAEVTLDDLEPEGTISSPYTLSGMIPGTWMFEGSFTVLLYDEDGTELGEWILSVGEGEDWMSEDEVSFTGELDFDAGDSVGGTLVFRAANPSDIEGNCREMHMTVAF